MGVETDRMETSLNRIYLRSAANRRNSFTHLYGAFIVLDFMFSLLIMTLVFLSVMSAQGVQVVCVNSSCFVVIEFSLGVCALCPNYLRYTNILQIIFFHGFGLIDASFV